MNILINLENHMNNFMKIIHKSNWGFWIFSRYSFILENEEEGLDEIVIDKKTWNNFEIGDFYDSHYGQFFKYDQRNKNNRLIRS